MKARSPHVGWLSAPRPTIGVEIAPRRVVAVSLGRAPDGPVVSGWAIEPLPEAAVAPALTGANIPDRALVVDALKRAFAKLDERPRRIALVLPDTVAKVSLVRFEQVPARVEDLSQLIRLQVRKTAPFRIEEAQVAYAPASPIGDGGREFLVALARREVIEEYENACAAAGAHAGVVDLASLNLINAVLAGGRTPRAGDATAPTGDWLLVHVTPDYSSLAIVRGEDLIFFRNRTAEADGSLADLVHQTAMYYEDRLGGGGFTHVYLVGTTDAGDAEAVRRSLEERLATRVEAVDPRVAAALRDRITATPGLLDALAPSIGLLLREQAA
jgi:type IV pilus assembly protein PilM